MEEASVVEGALFVKNGGANERLAPNCGSFFRLAGRSVEPASVTENERLPD